MTHFYQLSLRLICLLTSGEAARVIEVLVVVNNEYINLIANKKCHQQSVDIFVMWDGLGIIGKMQFERIMAIYNLYKYLCE
jgi:hypothetical protein